MHPPAPWQMYGDLWLSLFRVPEPVDTLRPAGVYGVALVRYEEPSPLTYGELLVARPVREPRRAVTITDIWVDSVDSRTGGRELWAIPKELCDFSWEASRSGPLSRTRATARLGSRPIASARFTDVSRAAPRVPFRGATWQPPLDDPRPRTAGLSGSAKVLPCRGSWEFEPSGPLGWLADRRPLASARMTDFRMRFG